jgi:hypothetical protein
MVRVVAGYAHDYALIFSRQHGRQPSFHPLARQKMPPNRKFSPAQQSMSGCYWGPMSQLGQKATFPQLSRLSALLPKPDVAHL